MGTVFCSYYMENSYSRLRTSILNSELAIIKAQLRTTNSNISYTLSNNINAEIDNTGNTPLLFSIEYQKLESFRFLLNEFKPDPNCGNYHNGFKPLHILAMTRLDTKSSFRDDVARYGTSKIALSPDMNYESFDKNDTKTISGKSVVETNYGSYTNMNQINFEFELGHCFTTISEDMLKEMTQLLIKKGADLDGITYINKFQKLDGYSLKTVTPLYAAIFSNNIIFVEELVRAGCNCDYQDDSSKIAAIHIACRLSKTDIVNVLITIGDANLNLKSKNGDTCLHWLAKSNRDDTFVFQLIMNHLSEPRERYTNEEKFTTFLMSYIDQANNDGQTALMLAAKNNHQNLVKFLLDYDASIILTDKDGLKAIQYAKQNSCAQLINSYAQMAKLNTQKSTDYLNRPNSDAINDTKIDVEEVQY